MSIVNTIAEVSHVKHDFVVGEVDFTVTGNIVDSHMEEYGYFEAFEVTNVEWDTDKYLPVENRIISEWVLFNTLELQTQIDEEGEWK